MAPTRTQSRRSVLGPYTVRPMPVAPPEPDVDPLRLRALLDWASGTDLSAQMPPSPDARFRMLVPTPLATVPLDVPSLLEQYEQAQAEADAAAIDPFAQAMAALGGRIAEAEQRDREMHAIAPPRLQTTTVDPGLFPMPTPTTIAPPERTAPVASPWTLGAALLAGLIAPGGDYVGAVRQGAQAAAARQHANAVDTYQAAVDAARVDHEMQVRERSERLAAAVAAAQAEDRRVNAAENARFQQETARAGLRSDIEGLKRNLTDLGTLSTRFRDAQATARRATSLGQRVQRIDAQRSAAAEGMKSELERRRQMLGPLLGVVNTNVREAGQTARKAAELGARRQIFDVQQGTREDTLAETKRHNRAMESRPTSGAARSSGTGKGEDAAIAAARKRLADVQRDYVQALTNASGTGKDPMSAAARKGWEDLIRQARNELNTLLTRRGRVQPSPSRGKAGVVNVNIPGVSNVRIER